MRRALLAVATAAVLLLSGCTDDVPAPGRVDVDVDTPQLRELKAEAGIEDCAPGTAEEGGLPAITLPCLGGGPDVDLATLDGPMIVNLWQSFCDPCRREMPALQQFHERYGDRVAVLGIDSADLQPLAALEFAQKTGVTYPLLADPNGDLSAADPFPFIRGYPYLAILDADGTLVYQKFGGVDSYGELVELVEDNLEVAL
ncbi:TlpA disulfide reductase family protein [Nocardioides sp. YIM 152315]|uniref:TlpA family protein disulfide reductase n=1 Tax=Nocardioides sp. YIM 152315 TaxID=3031760 RepID=UPI0023DB129B|nr:TlpA disulfide reductase family protein [Nocardioides sp. YIM 152315]MDF1603601.1 TlpA disulfide reductase family protein [Nocardioides sp. YIM 152315]